MDFIAYTSSKDQIEKLRSQNLIIDNETLAIQALNTYGYSNLIKSYREPYLINIDGKRVYRSGVRFEQILSLYTLDKNLRNAVIASMLDLEEYLKEQAANVIAQSFGTHQDDYLKFRNYNNKKRRKPQFTLTSILDTMNRTLQTTKDPIHHYSVEHGIVPPWILFKSIYFSTIVNFINLFKIPEQEKLVQRLYDTGGLNLGVQQLRFLMMDTLYICLEYRNISAHGGRVYNYYTSGKLREPEIFGSNNGFSFHGFSQLLALLSLISYKGPVSRLDAVLNQEVNRHCNQFPEDVTYLSQILNIDISKQSVVFVSDKSTRYHLDPRCSGLHGAHPIELEQAVAKGYIPCKKCAKDKAK